jgi:hypothetical protein
MVNIPIDAHFLTFTVDHAEIVQRVIDNGRLRPSTIQRERVIRTEPFAPQRSASGLRSSILAANQIFAPASVVFVLRNTYDDTVPAPGGNPQLDDNGFMMLARDFPAPTLGGISLLLVKMFRGSEGGVAAEPLGVCAVSDVAPNSSLAHELGHLLGLEHQGDIRDMMNPGLSVPQPTLSAAEIAAIQASALYRRMSSTHVSATLPP